ncbi:hypothetical protein NMY22_g10055 [Coprinellus aureogranulatus]|nr:hypothetical protein NMY22_g10055 [Coprinellus aureogranulatus]
MGPGADAFVLSSLLGPADGVKKKDFAKVEGVEKEEGPPPGAFESKKEEDLRWKVAFSASTPKGCTTRYIISLLRFDRRMLFALVFGTVSVCTIVDGEEAMHHSVYGPRFVGGVLDHRDGAVFGAFSFSSRCGVLALFLSSPSFYPSCVLSSGSRRSSDPRYAQRSPSFGCPAIHETHGPFLRWLRCVGLVPTRSFSTSKSSYAWITGIAWGCRSQSAIRRYPRDGLFATPTLSFNRIVFFVKYDRRTDDSYLCSSIEFYSTKWRRFRIGSEHAKSVLPLPPERRKHSFHVWPSRALICLFNVSAFSSRSSGARAPISLALGGKHRILKAMGVIRKLTRMVYVSSSRLDTPSCNVTLDFSFDSSAPTDAAPSGEPVQQATEVPTASASATEPRGEDTQELGPRANPASSADQKDAAGYYSWWNYVGWGSTPSLNGGSADNTASDSAKDTGVGSTVGEAEGEKESAKANTEVTLTSTTAVASASIPQADSRKPNPNPISNAKGSDSDTGKNLGAGTSEDTGEEAAEGRVVVGPEEGSGGKKGDGEVGSVGVGLGSGDVGLIGWLGYVPSVLQTREAVGADGETVDGEGRVKLDIGDAAWVVITAIIAVYVTVNRKKIFNRK